MREKFRKVVSVINLRTKSPHYSPAALSLSLKISEKGRRPGFFHLHERALPPPPLPNPPHRRPGTPPQKATERSKTGGVAPPLPPVSRLFPANFGHLCPRSILQKVDLVLLYRSIRRPDPGKWCVLNTWIHNHRRIVRRILGLQWQLLQRL
ncbi:hypothetical protein Pyn_22219 [Prunus yedoensis var. nudiflora]|uniref:Uncharacterized protein n=1 Tax=Prunus yedoensis var. nudiflora TaxID=2094558 RepID=A0A314ZLS3_PRUYE|nr:hypothetical protein Pyn_22219 [Prunus yedoensis var. nudiflora]